MQPYLFPYLGYFQLIGAVDEFWLLDTAQFIRRGWMNRNCLEVSGQRKLFTIPVNRRPRSDPIASQSFAPNAARECEKIAKTLRLAYAGSPCLDTAIALVQEFGEHIARARKPADFTDGAEFALNRCLEVFDLRTPIRRLSSLGLDSTLVGQERILAACRAIGANTYANMIGGRHLYDADLFKSSGVNLCFLDPVLPRYDQGQAGFLAGLSILDIVANVPPEGIREMLRAARTVSADPSREHDVDGPDAPETAAIFAHRGSG